MKDIVINKTNEQDSQMLILYHDVDDVSQGFVREVEEFRNKFELCESLNSFTHEKMITLHKIVDVSLKRLNNVSFDLTKG